MEEEVGPEPGGSRPVGEELGPPELIYRPFVFGREDEEDDTGIRCCSDTQLPLLDVAFLLSLFPPLVLLFPPLLEVVLFGFWSSGVSVKVPVNVPPPVVDAADEELNVRSPVAEFPAPPLLEEDHVR